MQLPSSWTPPPPSAAARRRPPPPAAAAARLYIYKLPIVRFSGCYWYYIILYYMAVCRLPCQQRVGAGAPPFQTSLWGLRCARYAPNACFHKLWFSLERVNCLHRQ